MARGRRELGRDVAWQVMFVYLGSLGRAAVGDRATGAAEWALRVVGLLATVAVTVYVTRVARRAIRQRTTIDRAANTRSATIAPEHIRPRDTGPWSVVATMSAALAAFIVAIWMLAWKDSAGRWVERRLGVPPSITAVEAYETHRGGPTFDHSVFDGLVRKHVDDAGLVNYVGIQEDAGTLDRYLRQLAAAPFGELGRDEKLALLINAYNAFTLRLILDYYPIGSIRDIPADKRWEHVRWQIGDEKWSLDQIEHQRIRPRFREPRIHFALVCAALGCPPLRNEAYTVARSTTGS